MDIDVHTRKHIFLHLGHESTDHTSEQIADDELLDLRSCEQFVHDASWLVRGRSY